MILEGSSWLCTRARVRYGVLHSGCSSQRRGWMGLYVNARNRKWWFLVLLHLQFLYITCCAITTSIGTLQCEVCMYMYIQSVQLAVVTCVLLLIFIFHSFFSVVTVTNLDTDHRISLCTTCVHSQIVIYFLVFIAFVILAGWLWELPFYSGILCPHLVSIMALIIPHFCHNFVTISMLTECCIYE